MAGARTAILQSTVTADMQGRVLALYRSIIQSMVPLGLIVAGPIADIMNVRFVFVISAIVVFVIVGYRLLTPAIIDIEESHATDP